MTTAISFRASTSGRRSSRTTASSSSSRSRARLRPDRRQRLPAGCSCPPSRVRPRPGSRSTGVLHEFSFLPGATEDSLDILASLRRVVFKLHGERSRLIRLRVTGRASPRRSDFETDHDLGDPQSRAAPAPRSSATSPSRWKSTSRRAAATSRPTSARRRRSPVNALAMDADFSPVKTVNFRVEPAKRKPGAERLVLELWTNGSVSPEDAGRRGGAHPRGPLQPPLPLPHRASSPRRTRRRRSASRLNENLFRSVDELELSVRAYNCLKTANIRTIADLVAEERGRDS